MIKSQFDQCDSAIHISCFALLCITYSWTKLTNFLFCLVLYYIITKKTRNFQFSTIWENVLRRVFNIGSLKDHSRNFSFSTVWFHVIWFFLNFPWGQDLAREVFSQSWALSQSSPISKSCPESKSPRCLISHGELVTYIDRVPYFH